MDYKRDVNFEINYDIKLSQSGQIYYMTDHITNHIIIRFHDITITITILDQYK